MTGMERRKRDSLEDLHRQIADLERDSLNRLHQLDRETGGDVEGLANLEKAIAFMTAGRVAEEYRRATGEPELPVEAQTQIRDFLEQARDRADLLADAARVDRRIAERGARGLIERQRMESEGNQERASRTRKPALADAIKKLAREPESAKQLFNQLYSMMDAHREEVTASGNPAMCYFDDAGREQRITLKRFENRLSEARKKSR